MSKRRLSSFFIFKVIYFVERNMRVRVYYMVSWVSLYLPPWFIQFIKLLDRYEGQRDMLYNQTFNLDQVAFASEGIKDAQQTVCPIIVHSFLNDVHYRKLTLSSPYGIAICGTGLNQRMGNYTVKYISWNWVALYLKHWVSSQADLGLRFVSSVMTCHPLPGQPQQDIGCITCSF